MLFQIKNKILVLKYSRCTASRILARHSLVGIRAWHCSSVRESTTVGIHYSHQKQDQQILKKKIEYSPPARTPKTRSTNTKKK